MGDVLKLAHSGESCHHHCNQFRLEKLHPRLLRLHRAMVCWTEMETEKVKQGFLGREISESNFGGIAKELD